MRVAEPEFAFRIGRTLAPRGTPWTVAEVMAAVADLYPAIADSRDTDFVAAGAPQLIADNACAQPFVLGPPTHASWRDLELGAYPVRARAGDGPWVLGHGADVLGAPRGAAHGQRDLIPDGLGRRLEVLAGASHPSATALRTPAWSELTAACNPPVACDRGCPPHRSTCRETDRKARN
jgi:hypothetical protein